MGKPKLKTPPAKPKEQPKGTLSEAAAARILAQTNKLFKGATK